MTGLWGFIAAIVVARMAFGYQFQTLASLGPTLVATFGLGYAALGSLIGLYMAPGILVALPGGLLGRRYGERVVVGGGLTLMTLGALVSAAASGPGGIGVGRALSGAGAVLVVVMQGKMVSDRVEGAQFLTIMGLLVGAFPVGVGLVGLSLEPLVRGFGWPGLFGAGAGLAALSLLLFLPHSLPAPTTAASSGWAMPSRRECALVTVAGLVWTAYNAGYYGFLSYMPSVLAVRQHPASLTALVLTIATWSNLPATLIGGALAGRFGSTPVFMVGSVAGVVAVGGLAFTDWPLLWGVLFGTVASLQAGVIVALGTLSARPENRAVGMGLFYAVYYVGGTVLPALCGRAADAMGDPSGALLAAAALSALAVPLYGLHAWLNRMPAVTAPRPGTGTLPG